ncbi:hypothetical protein KQX54_000250, partial [Cotesia glomerata]
MLCMYAFPTSVTIRSACRSVHEDCMAIRHEFCISTSWALIEATINNEGFISRSRGHFRLPDCDIFAEVRWTSLSAFVLMSSFLTDVNQDLVT